MAVAQEQEGQCDEGQSTRKMEERVGRGLDSLSPGSVGRAVQGSAGIQGRPRTCESLTGVRDLGALILSKKQLPGKLF